METQGSSGSTPLDPAVIRAADAVIFAVDVGVRDQDRFAGKPLVQSGTKRAINEPDVMIREALAAADDPNGRRVAGTAGGGRRGRDRAAAARGTGAEIRRWLLTGVSYMIPFVAAGGLLIALGFLLRRLPDRQPQPGRRGPELRAELGAQQLPLRPARRATRRGPQRRLPRLPRRRAAPCSARPPSASSSRRWPATSPTRSPTGPGIAPGFVVGAGRPSTVGAGFLGGLVGGILAGFAALWISRWKLPAGVRGLQPVVIIPLLATLISSGLMVVVLGRPLAAALDAAWATGSTA